MGMGGRGAFLWQTVEMRVGVKGGGTFLWQIVEVKGWGKRGISMASVDIFSMPLILSRVFLIVIHVLVALIDLKGLMRSLRS